jgi:glycosyltransferase involved in cell wall biosynthesis
MPVNHLVSVAVHTYNHRSFIGQAIESILAQRRDFPIEIVISDDCSPDGAGKVIDEHQARYPELFVRLDPERNVGAHANFSRVWTGCRGKYIALLDGDDWWHSPDKLRTQVAFMEAHPEYTISGHTVRVVRMPDGRELETQPPQQHRRQPATVQDLIPSNYLHSCSVMCRRGFVPAMPAWTERLSMGDWPLWILHALHGPIGFIDRPYGTYRLHEGGTWSTLDPSQMLLRTLHALRVMRANFPPKVRDDFSKAICQHEYALICLYTNQGQLGLARQALLRFLHVDPAPDGGLKQTLHWHFRKVSERHGLLSQERLQWLKLAYRVDPSGLNPFHIVGNLARKACDRLWGENRTKV